MKTSKILFVALTFTAAILVGCSENPSSVNVNSERTNEVMKTNVNNGQSTFFWNCKGVSIQENAELVSSNEVVSPSLPASISSVKLTFNGSTNQSHSNYVAILSVYETEDLRRMPVFTENILVYSESDPAKLNGYHEVNLNISEGLIINGHAVRIVVSLCETDPPTVGGGERSFLNLSDINIYTYPRN